MADKISMADLLAGNLAIDWFETVSLVREVCTVLVAERIYDSTPELAQILLGANGRIRITGTAHGDNPVRRLGQLLQALLRSSDPPVTLRLVLSEAMAVPPVYGTIPELDAALAYFERPDRYAVLKDLYQRASEAEPTPETLVTPAQDLDAIAPLPQPEKKKRSAPSPSNRRATVMIVAVTVALTATIVAYQRGLLTRSESLKQAGGRASAAVDKAVFKTVSAVTEIAGMGTLVAPGAPLNLPAPALPATTVPRRANRPAPINLAGVPVKLFDLQPVEDVQPAIDSPASVPMSVLEASVSPQFEIDSKLYGPEDRQVMAPQMIRPHLPTALPEGVQASQLARIQLVVAPDGLVESVKLVPGTNPVSVTEAMLLSAAKAWRFSPAVKDGNAVRYRKTVYLSDK